MQRVEGLPSVRCTILLGHRGAQGFQAPSKSKIWWLPIGRGLNPLPIGSLLHKSLLPSAFFNEEAGELSSREQGGIVKLLPCKGYKKRGFIYGEEETFVLRYIVRDTRHPYFKRVSF